MTRPPNGRDLRPDPLDYPLPDTLAEAERLAASIEQAVQQHTGGVHDLRVRVNHRGVHLEGRCATYYCKQLAQQAAMDLSGERLDNRIEVS